MKRNTTFNLPEDLIQRAKVYAAEHDTTLTAIVRRHLEQVTGYATDAAREDPMLAFSKGEIGKAEAIQKAGLRDYAELLVALGQRGLSLPTLPPHEVREMTDTFLRLRHMGAAA
jgi:plasmid stability protein